MGYSKTMLKGRIGYNTIGWPLIVLERAKSDNPNTPVLCEVFGYAHESGSVYYKDIQLTTDETDENAWSDAVRAMGCTLGDIYFKGKLICQ